MGGVPQAMKACQVLLASKPEEEATLLKILVNKLGDPSRKVQLQVPNMHDQETSKMRTVFYEVHRECLDSPLETFKQIKNLRVE